MRPETLALAADLAIRLFDAKHLDLVARVDAYWSYPVDAKWTRTVEVRVYAHVKPGATQMTRLYTFDGPVLVADHNKGRDSFPRYVGNNVVVL